MENEFIPYDEALALKELGFDKPCFKVYDTMKFLQTEVAMNTCEIECEIKLDRINAPLYQQALKFLLEKIPSYCYRMCYNDTGEIYNPDGSTYDIFNDKDELIRTLIDLININNSHNYYLNT